MSRRPLTDIERARVDFIRAANAEAAQCARAEQLARRLREQYQPPPARLPRGAQPLAFLGRRMLDVES